MKGTDKFLIGIVACIVLLIGVVFAVALLRSSEPGYQPDATPEGVAHNYLLALQLKDYERAQAYLSPSLPGYPADGSEFADDVDNDQVTFWGFQDHISLAIEAVKITGDRAKVSIRQTKFRRAGLLRSGGYMTDFDMTLGRKNGEWKIYDSGRFWSRCWNVPDRTGCR